MNGHPDREKKLAAVAKAHGDWQQAHAGKAAFDPVRAAKKPGSDYNLHHLDVNPPPGAEEDFHQRVQQATGMPGADAKRAREVKDVAAAITSVTGRESAVRGHLEAAGAALEDGDAKTAYGALDLARRHALGEFGDNPDRGVLLADKTEAWRPILKIRDSLRSQP